MREDIMAQCYSQIEAMLIEQSMVALPVLRAIGDSTADAGAFGRLLNIRVERPEPGVCRCSAEAGNHLWNPFGVVHGAVAYALMDTAMAVAGNSVMLAGQRCVTTDMQVRYLGTVRRARLIAEARVTGRQEDGLHLVAEVRSGDRVIAMATGVFAIVGGMSKG